MFAELAKQNYDVIAVGGGPAGSISARECAKYGLKTLVIDKRQELGAPVRCGEGLGEVWLKKALLEYDPSWCLWESHGAIVYAPNGKKVEIRTKNKGWVIERKLFEKKLAEQAIHAGAKYLLKSRVYNVLKEKDTVCGVRVETPEGNFNIRAKLVIAADGVDSKTARCAGINTFNPISEVDSGYEYEMTGVKCEPNDLIHLFVGNEIASRGYVWIFYKSVDRANVGIGISGATNKDGTTTAKYYLDKFIASHPEFFKNAGIIEIKGGCCPVSAPLEKPYANGLLIVGDAAHMVNPIHGGGMGTAMEAAMIAGKIAKKAIDSNDISEKTLKEYAEKWYKERGNQLLQVLKVRRFFEKLSDKDLNDLADIFTPETLLEFADGKKLNVFLKVFAKKPRLALMAAMVLR
jgi:digeranylgeranylglycerophospholipid reductase